MHIYFSRHGFERAKSRAGWKGNKRQVARRLAARLKEELRAGVKPDRNLCITIRAGPDLEAIFAPGSAGGWVLVTIIKHDRGRKGSEDEAKRFDLQTYQRRN